MASRVAGLIWLPCCIAALLFASLAGTRASVCLPSAAAVKEAYPWSRPHWRFWSQNGDETRCWHPGTYAKAHRSGSLAFHRRDPIGASKAVAADIDGPSNQSLSSASEQTSGTGPSLEVPAVPASPAAEEGQSSFADRFAAVFEVILFERPSVMQRMEGAFPRTP